MGKATIERLEGYSWGLSEEEHPTVDPKDGLPLHDGLGNPKTHAVTVLHLIQMVPPGWPGERHRVEIPMTPEMKAGLIEGLTGGIQIARELPTIEVPS